MGRILLAFTLTLAVAVAVDYPGGFNKDFCVSPSNNGGKTHPNSSYFCDPSSEFGSFEASLWTPPPCGWV